MSWLYRTQSPTAEIVGDASTLEALLRAGELATDYADTLIAIAARFMTHPSGTVSCWNCGEAVEHGCDEQCPGLTARRALGVG